MLSTPLLLAALIGAASVPVKVFEDEFDRYSEHPEIFSEKTHIEEAPSSLKTINFFPEKQEQLRKTPFIVPDDPVNFDFKFDFRFTPDSKREFTVQLFMADPEKPKAAPVALNLTISETVSSLATKPLVGRASQWLPKKHLDGSLPEFPDYFMHKARLEVREGYARLYVLRKGKWYLEAWGQLLRKGMILTSFNVLSASQVTLDSFQVWKYPADAKSPAFQKEFAFDGKEAAFEVADLPYPAQYQIRLLDEKENKTVVNFSTMPERKYIDVTKKDGKTVVTRDLHLPDAGIVVSVPSTKAIAEVRTRPNLKRYGNEGIAEIAAKWESFPAASKTPMHIRLKQTAPGVCEFWINEKMFCAVKTEAALKKIVFDLPGGTLRPLAARQIPASKEFQTVDPVAALNWSKLWADPATNRLAKYSEVCGVPFLSAKEYSFPLSVCEENKAPGLETDGYLERRAFDAMPSSIHFSVPVAQYIKAYALCSVDPEATPDMVPEVTARLTNYTIRGGRGNGFSHHTVRLPAKPGDPLPPNVKIAGGTKENPIYFVEFNIDAGAIEDIIFREGNTTLDFEFLGRLYDHDNYYQSRATKPSLTKSSVILHAATLKQTPAEMRVDQVIPGALWYLNENPRMNVHVKPLEKGSWTVKTEITDLEGKVLTSLSKKVTEEKDLEVRFPQKEYGWYGVKTVLEDAKGTPLVTRNSSFVLLPPDTRKAGPESPFHAWSWDHLYGVDISLWGEMLKRMGTRHVTNLKNETEGAPWKLYKGQLPQISPLIYRTEEKLKNAIEQEVANFPHCKTALVLHEYGANTPWPLELIGKKTPVTPEQEKRDKEAAEYALSIAKAWRKYAPGIRLLTGNSQDGLRVLSMLFRQKYPREYIDAMGDECGGLFGFGTAPEFGIGYGAWALTKLAQVYGYKDLKPDACYEFKIRNNRNVPPRRFASCLIRDNLIAFAWGYTLVNGGMVGNHISPYYNSIWGAMGSFSRYPLWDPMPSAAANAAQTLVLDCAKYSRMIPTGSDTVYAEEFRRGNEYVYAIWTARGETAADLTFEKPASILRTEMYGKQINEKTSGTALEIPVSDDPVYLTTTVPLKSVQVKAFRTFNKEPLPAGKMDLVCAMDDASAWDAVSGVDPRILIGGDEQKHLFEPAKFEIRTADDEVKGKTVEVELAKDENCPELVQETGFIRLKTPIEIPGKPHTIGVSCKGNSSWGKLYFEITDAEGEVFLTAGTGGYGCPVYDWDFTMGLNYDNWHTLVFPLTDASPVKIHSPGENVLQWQRSGGKFANGRVDYPVKLTAIGFTMFRKFLIINQMKKTGRTIRFRDFVSWSDK